MISIVVPVYNEEEALEDTINELAAIKEQSDLLIEIIIVNDGSNDKSTRILSSIPNSQGIEVIHHHMNLGYGAALKTGIRNAEHAMIAITDADRTYPNDQIPKLAQICSEGDFDMVVGSRTGGNIHFSKIRTPAKWVVNKLANYLTGIRIPDLNSGLRVMKKDVVERFMQLLPNGFSFTSTLTLAMLTNHFKVEYVPVNYYKRKGKSKIRPIYDTVNFLQLIIRTTLYFNPLAFFIPLSLILVALAFLVLVGSWILLGKPMDVTFGIILMTAVVLTAIGMLADLIVKRISIK